MGYAFWGGLCSERNWQHNAKGTEQSEHGPGSIHTLFTVKRRLSLAGMGALAAGKWIQLSCAYDLYFHGVSNSEKQTQRGQSRPPD